MSKWSCTDAAPRSEAHLSGGPRRPQVRAAAVTGSAGASRSRPIAMWCVRLMPGLEAADFAACAGAAISERHPSALLLLDEVIALGRAEDAVPDAVPVPLAVDNAALCVVTCGNTQRRKRARDRAVEVVAYDNVLKMLDPDSELRDEAERKQVEARNRLDREIAGAFQLRLPGARP